MRFHFLLAELASEGSVPSSYFSGRIEGAFPILKISYANPESQRGPYWMQMGSPSISPFVSTFGLDSDAAGMGGSNGVGGGIGIMVA
jgi:hypothetical protein